MGKGLKLSIVFLLSMMIFVVMLSKESHAAAVNVTVFSEKYRQQPNVAFEATVKVTLITGHFGEIDSVHYYWDGEFAGDITDEVKANDGIYVIPDLRSTEEGTVKLEAVVLTDDEREIKHSVNYIFDATAPIISLESAVEPTTPQKSHTVTVVFSEENDINDRYYLSHYWSDVDLNLAENPDAIEDWVDDGMHNLQLFLDDPTYNSPADAANGPWYFYVKVTDEVGNETLDQIGPLYIDQTPPVLELINGLPPACSILAFPEVGTEQLCEGTGEYTLPIFPMYVNLVVDGKKHDELEGYTFRYYVSKEPKFYWSGDPFDGWGEVLNKGRFELGGFLIGPPEDLYYVLLSIENPAGNRSYHLSHGMRLDADYTPEFYVRPEAILYINKNTLDVQVYYKNGDQEIDSLVFMHALSWKDKSAEEEYSATEEDFIPMEVTGMSLVEDDESWAGYYSGHVTLDLEAWGPLQEGIEYDVDAYYIVPESGFLLSPMGPFFYYDVTPPKITSVTYDPIKDPDTPYSGTVTATVEYEDEQRLPGGGKTKTVEYIFTTNGTRDITLEDAAGNTVSYTLKVDWIEAPYTVTYSPAEGVWTNQSVIATITFDEDIWVTFDDMDEPVNERTYEITNNGLHTLGYVDAGDFPGTIELFVDWIDKTPPMGSIFYKIDEDVRGVIATLVASDDSGVAPILTDANGNAIAGEWTHTFTSNGTHTFHFKDVAGNSASRTAVVNHFDTTPPELSLQYSTTDLTNTSVRVTVKANEPIRVLNNGGLTYYDFEVNDEFTFQVEDRFGNAAEITAVVNNIDKEPPVPVITYSTTELTKDNVVATISVEADEDFTVLNNFGKKGYIFTENGEFTFIIADPAGNRVEAKATVGNIDKSKVSYTLTYSEEALTRNDVTVTVVPEAGKTLNFPDNGNSPSVTFEDNGIRWLLAVDDLGNEYWIQLMVQWIDKEAPKITIDRDYVVPQGGEVPDLTAGVTAKDNIEVDTIVHAGAVDTSNIGTYEVTYTATDTVGNTSTLKRLVKVVGTEELAIYVNGQKAEEGMHIHANVLYIDVVGMIGQWELHGTIGELKIGKFKSGQYVLDPDQPVEVTKQGGYTLLVRDQELQQQFIQVYVIPQGRRR